MKETHMTQITSSTIRTDTRQMHASQHDGFQLPAIQREHDARSLSTRARFWHRTYASNWQLGGRPPRTPDADRIEAAAAFVAKCQRRKAA
jgi:hypothetical protein